MALLRNIEKRLLRNPEQAAAYMSEMPKLEAGVVKEVTTENRQKDSWYIPHHLVTHNGQKSPCV